MRSEHKTTNDESDAFSRWRHVLVSMRRAGARKVIKQRSHRKDRHQARRDATEERRARVIEAAEKIAARSKELNRRLS